MHNRSLALLLLSLFTTRQRAAAIEGDLIEESEHRGSRWFAMHVVGTTLALFRESVRRAPFRISVLTVCAVGLSFMTCGVATAAFMAPDAFVPVPFLGFVAIFLWAFSIGFGLEYLAPGFGIRAATLTVLLLLLLFIVTAAPSWFGALTAYPQPNVDFALLRVFASIVAMLGKDAAGWRRPDTSKRTARKTRN
jgi:hypothetical protein